MCNFLLLFVVFTYNFPRNSLIILGPVPMGSGSGSYPGVHVFENIFDFNIFHDCHSNLIENTQVNIKNNDNFYEEIINFDQ